MQIKINDCTFEGSQIKTPNVAILTMTGRYGFLACGYINADAGDRFGDAVAIVRGVKTFDDMLNAAVQDVNQTAAARGATIGMTGRDFLLCCAEPLEDTP